MTQENVANNPGIMPEGPAIMPEFTWNMPDFSSAVNLDAARAWLSEKWTESNQCPISGHNSWSISADIVQPATSPSTMISPTQGLMLGGRAYPLVMVTCTECGYAMFFNAVVMGLR